MNERINELVGQAKVMAEESTNKKISANTELYAFAEKFAEMIVKECIAVHEDNYGIDIIGDVLKKHFGVE
jgi:tRNA A37 threonylcarbamoyladenosine dehydratase